LTQIEPYAPVGPGMGYRRSPPAARRRCLSSNGAQDRDFLAEAYKAGLEITPVAGEEIQKLVRQVNATPDGIARKAAELLQ
jgi:hypothetical protein